MNAEMVVAGKNLYEIRMLLSDFEMTVTHPFDISVYRSSWTHRAKGVAPDSICVAIETVVGDAGQDVVQQVVDLLAVPAKVSEGVYPRLSTKRNMFPR